MSSKSHRLQRDAARMIVYGAHDWDIINELKIRHSTLQRWRRTPRFIAEIEIVQDEMRQQLPMRMLRLFNNFLDASERSLREDSTAKNLSTMLEMMQAIEKDRMMSIATLPKSAETVPNRSETVLKRSESVPNVSETAQNSV